MLRIAVGLLVLLGASLEGIPAQTSASYALREHVFNAGGNPAAGVTLASADFHLTLDSLGDGLPGIPASSLSFGLSPGFLAAYPPPGEVQNLIFVDPVSLAWDAERSAGTYSLYRDLTATLPGSYGACSQQALAAAAAADPGVPLVGTAFFYLVTARNRLAEEGTKGFRSDGTERLGTVCP